MNDSHKVIGEVDVGTFLGNQIWQASFTFVYIELLMVHWKSSTGVDKYANRSGNKAYGANI